MADRQADFNEARSPVRRLQYRKRKANGGKRARSTKKTAALSPHRRIHPRRGDAPRGLAAAAGRSFAVAARPSAQPRTISDRRRCRRASRHQRGTADGACRRRLRAERPPRRCCRGFHAHRNDPAGSRSSADRRDVGRRRSSADRGRHRRLDAGVATWPDHALVLAKRLGASAARRRIAARSQRRTDRRQGSDSASMCSWLPKASPKGPENASRPAAFSAKNPRWGSDQRTRTSSWQPMAR